MEFLVRYKYLLATALLLLSLIGIPYMKSALIPNNELKIWFVENDPTLEAYQNFCNQYGNDRIIMILIYDSIGIFQSHRIRQIKKITQELVKINGVNNVHSLTNIKDLFRIRVNDTLRIKYESPFLNIDIEQKTEIDRVRDQVMSSSIFLNHAINKEGNASIIILQLDAFEEIDSRRGILIDEIESLARDSFQTNEIHMGGLDIFTNELNRLSKHDFGIFMGFTYLIIFLLILWFFRKTVYVILSLITMIVSVVLTLSIYGYTGHQLNIFSLIIPPLIVILGLINILHIINEYEFSISQSSQLSKKQDVLIHSLQQVFKPCLFTALTTMIGFLSLVSSSTAILREFGMFSALGILIVFICSFVFSAAILGFVKPTNIYINITNQIGNFLISISNDIQSNARKYWIALSLLFLISLYGIYKIKADMFVMEYFPKTNDVIRDHNFITKLWGNYFPIDFLITTKEGFSFKNAGMLKSLNEFQKEVNNIHEINNSMSFINLIDKASEVLYRKDLEHLLISSTQTNRLLNLLERRSEIDFSSFMSEDYHTARIKFTGPLLSVSELGDKINEIKQISNKHFGNKAQLSESSYPALYLKIMNYAVDSMITSFGLAIILIFMTLSILLRNIRLSLIAMIPNLFPIFLMFAFMGWFEINLDLTTATVASIALGIAVDNTIHILSHYQKERNNRTTSFMDAMIKTYYHIGKVVVIGSVVICIGYLILFLASIKTVMYFGILIFLASSTALVGDVVLLPLLLKAFEKKD
jgi:predicted RND superfamily exporter protein